MRRCLCGATLLILITPMLPTFAAEEDKDTQKPAAKEKLVAIGQLRGKVTIVPSSHDKITLQVSSDRLQPKRSGRRSSYQIKQSAQKIDLQVAEDVKVRTQQPPIALDDKGNPKKYSAAELKELRGPGNLPGYTADFSDLRAGQIVEVYLARKRKNGMATDGKNKGQVNGEKPTGTINGIAAHKRQ